MSLTIDASVFVSAVLSEAEEVWGGSSPSN